MGSGLGERPERPPDATTSIEEHASSLAGAHSYLLVIENGSSSLFDLPSTGVVTIGRSPDVDLRLDHASVSRRHARLLMGHGEARVCDIGSHNGTGVNGAAVTGVRVLATGDVVSIGEVLLVIHAPARTMPSRRLVDESAWRRRLAEEVERSVSFGRPLGVLATAGIPAAARVFADAVLARALRGIDVAGAGDDGQLLVLLPEADAAAARRMAGAVARALGEIAAGTRVGVAICPSDAADTDSLLLIARAGARVAPEGGVADSGGAVVRLEMGDREVLLAHPAMVRVFELLARLATAELPVLIVGETGAGKENAAFAVHHQSSRRDRPFVAVNCATVNESLAESVLFGHDRGAFSGAVAAKAGLFENVAGGTLFLDEVGELAPPVQAKLLRALETGCITRLGEHRERAIDVRLVAATHRVLEDEVKAGRFRQDLYYRLRGACVVLPPLRERRCEIPILFRDFVARGAARAGRAAPEPSPAAMAALLAHDWPGNVRELKSVADYLVATVLGDRIEAGDLAGHVPVEPVAHNGKGPLGPLDEVYVTPGTPARGGVRAPMRPLSEEIDELVRRRIVEALAMTGNVKTHAARMLGMPLRTFTSKLRQLRLR